MKFLTAEQTPTTLNFEVWLDTSKVMSDGKTPDPAWVRNWTFTAKSPQGWKSGNLNGITYTDWPSYVTAEVKLLAQAEYDRLTADPTALAVQGTTF